MANSRNRPSVWGEELVSKRYFLRKITIYANGYVQVNGDLPEKLLSISGNTETLSTKSGLGRAAGAVLTFGLNLLTPNMRGRMYLTIVTDARSYSFDDAAEPYFLGVLNELVAIGSTVIGRGEHTKGFDGESPESSSKSYKEQKDTHSSLNAEKRDFDEPSKTSHLINLKNGLEKGAISKHEYEKQRDTLLASFAKPSESNQSISSEPNSPIAEQLVILHELHASGALTDQEFASAKAKTLKNS